MGRSVLPTDSPSIASLLSVVVTFTMDLNKELIGKAIGGVLGLALYVVAIKYAFAFTWPQGFVLGWLYWLLHDACLHPKR